MTTAAINATPSNNLNPITQALSAKAPVTTAISAADKNAATGSTVVSIGKPASASLGLYSSTGTTDATPSKKIEDAAINPVPQPDALAIIAGGVVAGSGHVVVDIKASDSGYDNKIYYSTDNFKTRQYIGVDNHTGSVDLGTFKPGTNIQFGIDNGQGQFFKAGAAASNTDNFKHDQTTRSSTGVQIGFEDLNGGGDRDFNDAIINVRNVPVSTSAPAVATPPTQSVLAQAAQSTVKPAPPPVKDNRSGLGDGTNLGQGAGKINSPNEGTNNPAAVKAPAIIPPVAVPVSKASTATVDAVAAKKTADAKNAAEVTAKAAAASKQLAADVAKKVAEAKTAAEAVAKKTADAKIATEAAVKTVVKPPEVKLEVKPGVTPVATPAKPVVAAPVVTKENRSGLGDGTNPGKGGGTTNSPNTGTINPGGLKKA